ncbi:hypothetical protein F2Q68_00036853 [Brassica cretica]|uniref:AMP-dependent synthetase/ligase domain-containing protein n=2 Tax=Brassica cretica TaxID=69181 RepID=A0A8S9H9H6_BRACR|nr:hypothetical protein F2Q68_00036853 [Brassica cretica]
MGLDDDDFVFHGTPIEREDEIASRKKKAVAGASGTLKTLPAWKQEFDTFGFTAAEQSRKQAEKEQHERPSAIPGPVHEELIAPAPESIGVKLLLKMGWRRGHSIKDVRASSDARREARKAFLAFSADENTKESSDSLVLETEAETSLGPQFSEDIKFSETTPVYVLNPKQDLHGLGYDPFKHAPEFREDTSGDNPGGNWLPGAYLNPARSCLSSGSKRRSDNVVIRWRNEGSDDLPVNTMTLLELRSQVWLTAHALNALDLEEESAIAIDMPMNVESVIIYLAIVLSGHVVVSIADSFSPREISTRLKISKAKAIFTQDEIIRGDKRIPLYRRVVDAEAPLAIVIPARGSFVRMNLRENDLSWNDFLGKAGNMRFNNNMDSFLILLKIERSLFSGEERRIVDRFKGINKTIGLGFCSHSALIIYPNELSKAAQLLLAKAKSFKEVSKKWCYAFEFVELGLSKR